MKYDNLWKMQRRFTNKLEFHFVHVFVAIFVYLAVQYVLWFIANTDGNPEYKIWSKLSIANLWRKEYIQYISRLRFSWHFRGFHLKALISSGNDLNRGLRSEKHFQSCLDSHGYK